MRLRDENLWVERGRGKERGKSDGYPASVLN